ncbi:serine/threonine-protein kinase [Kitasatospora mediocidica]|uniref:hypothetical protein n=1 Tax=Kitasatospora mediocidica TaxID=58352 RepID=UPI000A92C0AB|nr:hypothetical protein [Kitasatospora mediocidica]
MWKATGPLGAVAVKLGYSADGVTAEITTREAAVLDALPDYTVIAGRSGPDVWYVTTWLDGPSTWDLFEPVRKGPDGRVTALAGAVALCRAVAEFHAAGWAHGDLQPAHGIHTPAGAKLIDFALSLRQGTLPWRKFEGGMTHLVSPELAAWINSGLQPVEPSPTADVYALAGTLWTCATGRWPLDYDAASIDVQLTSPADLRKAIAAGIPLTTERPWPQLQSALGTVLTVPAADRPTAAELGDLLMDVQL